MALVVAVATCGFARSAAAEPERADANAVARGATAPAPLTGGVPGPIANLVERPSPSRSAVSERMVHGVPMPMLCARLAAWADDQGLSATGGAADLTGLMTARFDMHPRWWIETGVGAGTNYRGGADLLDPRRLGIATLHRVGLDLGRTNHTALQLRANVSTVTLSTRQLTLTFDLTVRVF